MAVDTVIMKHEFALYYATLSGLQSDIVITDPIVIHRITRVLRLKVADALVLFDRVCHYEASIQSIEKKQIKIVLGVQQHRNMVYKPSITALLPLLKRDAFEQAIYLLVEAGVTSIQPVITAKTQRKWGGIVERQRVERVIIAAAEQSKYYAFPEFKEPIILSDAIAQYNKGIFCDPEGMPLLELSNTLIVDKPKLISILIGPEGDLTHDEKQAIIAHGYCSYALTPTILRAPEAAFLITAFCRSITS